MDNEIYSIMFLISFTMLILLIAFFRDRITIYYALMFFSILIVNFGYMQMADASSLEMAVYSNQAVYLGASFCPFFLLMCIADLTKQKVSVGLQIFFICYGGFLFLFASSIGFTQLYYKSVSVETVDGVTRLVKEYGPLHFLSPLYYIIVTAIGVYFLAIAIWKNEEVSYVTSFGLILTGGSVITIYLLERMLSWKTEYLPLAYVIAQIGIFVLLGRVSMHDIKIITASSMVDSLTYGFALFDSKGRFLGSDIAAKTWFSELKFLRVDSHIRAENTQLLTQIGAWLRGEDDSEIVHFEIENKIIEVRHILVGEKDNKKIHCLYMRDDTNQQEYMKLVEQYNENLSHDVEVKTERIHQIQNDIIRSMASIVENRDNNTGGHIARTSDVVRIFVNHLMENEVFDFLSHDYAKRIIKSAPLHDFGKIGVPDVILNKPGKFTDEEYQVMKTHSAKGAILVEKILQNSEDSRFRQVAVNVAHFHHEKWDGNGYPTGIKGEEIPFEARVMALADVFDALVSKRVYKESFSYDKAFSIIDESCGSHFDPRLCTEFMKCRPLLEELYNSYED